MQATKWVLATILAGANIAAATGLAMPMLNLPPEETQGVVTYRTGGVGEEEATAMRLAESQYPLSLEFYAHGRPPDQFLTYVAVTIKDKNGKIALDMYSDGPILLARLPDGRYTVTASDAGKAKVRHVTVAADKPQRLVFEW
jgi:hypothetical protein